MRIPTWRLALTTGAVAVLAVAGMGLVAASSPAPVASPQAAATTDPGATARPERPATERLERRAALAARLLRLGRHLVHVEATVTDRDGDLVTVWLDHGTVQSAGNGSLSIAETGGTTQTVKTDDETIVRVGRQDGTLDDVKAGAEVFVQSRIVDGSPVAKRILILPAKPG